MTGFISKVDVTARNLVIKKGQKFPPAWSDKATLDVLAQQLGKRGWRDVATATWVDGVTGENV